MLTEDYFKNTAIYQPIRAETKTVSDNHQLPNWLTLQTILSGITLTALIIGFFVQNAIQNERAERLKIDFEAYKRETTDKLERLTIQNEQIKLELSRQQGMRDAETKKR